MAKKEIKRKGERHLGVKFITSAEKKNNVPLIKGCTATGCSVMVGRDGTASGPQTPRKEKDNIKDQYKVKNRQVQMIDSRQKRSAFSELAGFQNCLILFLYFLKKHGFVW